MKQLGHADEVCACGATGSHDHDGHCANHDGAECWYCEGNAYDIDNCKYCKGSGETAPGAVCDECSGHGYWGYSW